MNQRSTEDASSMPAAHSSAASGPVLLCFDGSESAGRAISAAGALLGSRAAIVLSVWEPVASLTSLSPVGDMVGQVTGIYREMDEIGARLADDRADEGAAIARRAGFDAQALTAQGKPWVEILRVAEDHNVMAIVLAGGPRAGVGSALIGGVPARVLHHCPRPVIVIPAAAAEG